MPIVEHEVKLDFKDVLIRPKRSTIKSRADVDLSRKFVFRHAKKHFPEDVIPVVAANMDTVGTFEMATVLAKHKILTAIHNSAMRNFQELLVNTTLYLIQEIQWNIDIDRKKIANEKQKNNNFGFKK